MTSAGIQSILTQTIQLVYNACHHYRSYSNNMKAVESSYPNFAKMFQKRSIKLCKLGCGLTSHYQNRFGVAQGASLTGAAPLSNPLDIIDVMLPIEDEILSALSELHRGGDARLQIYVAKFITKQDKVINDINTLLINLRRLAGGADVSDTILLEYDLAL